MSKKKKSKSKSYPAILPAVVLVPRYLTVHLPQLETFLAPPMAENLEQLATN